jgi:platelet-activating factor acetylhydrolase
VIPGVVDAPILSAPEQAILDDTRGNGVEAVRNIIDQARLASGERGAEPEIEGVEGGRGTLPCVVFTHGMAGMSQSYSHYLGSIASHGVVIAAVEHRDGSGPGTVVHYPDGKEKRVWHMKLEDLQ